jgi:S-methylmethionine-dependent homocysteine/selenocysteine methylase
MSLEALRERFENRPLVLDGATGTELERRGVACELPLWSAGALIDAPDVVMSIHQEYVEAGADIIVANTFRTNPRTLRRAGRLADGAALNVMAVDLARRAVGRGDVIVAASVAPVEDCYHPERVPSVPVLADEHNRMLNWLVRAAPDFILIETMNTGSEARAAALAATGCKLPFAVSFVVREDGNLLSGESLDKAVAAVAPLRPLAIGINCVPARGLTGLLGHLRSLTDRPLMAYGQVGNPRPIPGWSYSHGAEPAEYAACARSWLEAGASIVGGCCGTGPGHIRALRSVVAGDG